MEKYKMEIFLKKHIKWKWCNITTYFMENTSWNQNKSNIR